MLFFCVDPEAHYPEQQLATVESERLQEKAVKQEGREWNLRLMTHSFSFASVWLQIFVGLWGRKWIAAMELDTERTHIEMSDAKEQCAALKVD